MHTNIAILSIIKKGLVQSSAFTDTYIILVKKNPNTKTKISIKMIRSFFSNLLKLDFYVSGGSPWNNF